MVLKERILIKHFELIAVNYSVHELHWAFLSLFKVAELGWEYEL